MSDRELPKYIEMVVSEYRINSEKSLKVGTGNNIELFRTLLQPHFLFNSLNNLYTLSVNSSDKTTNAIANLSDLLRKIVIYSRCELISLEDEIQLVRNYIELEKCWLGEGFFMMDLQIKGDTFSIFIPPLILYTLVENAFKHGIRKCPQFPRWITVNILIKRGRIYCKIRNSCRPETDSDLPVTATGAGIGLEAVYEMLNSTYKGKYLLESKRVDNVYCVDLLIENASVSEDHSVA
ncbi:MAG: histidine kinase [Bacteroidales bacterium]|nr:histidine kinase [Bacteroidales bacterium]MBN2698346.1 histidine kinase [Bacteroidales bacterium]